jgi:hypothetical protein
VREQTTGLVICRQDGAGIRQTLAREEALALFVLLNPIRTPYNVLQGGFDVYAARIVKTPLTTPGKIARLTINVIAASRATLVEIYPLHAKLPLTL